MLNLKWILIIKLIFVTNIIAQGILIDTSFSVYNIDYLNEVLPPEAIKSVRTPVFLPLDQALQDSSLFYMKENDWMIAINYNQKTKLYPLMPLIWHEIVNDSINNNEIAVTYCVLTGSGLVFSRKINQKSRSFGVSGYLYNSNLVMYDYQTRSTWPQLSCRAYSGIEKGDSLSLLPFFLIKYSFAKKKYSHADVLIGSKRLARYQKMYNRYPFDGLDLYDNNNQIRHPVPKISLTDSTYSIKEKFFFFPKNNVAIPFKYIGNFNDRFFNLEYDNGELVAIKPKAGKIFINLYWFALKTFYPDANVITK